jgi:hypothetical protein
LQWRVMRSVLRWRTGSNAGFRDFVGIRIGSQVR